MTTEYHGVIHTFLPTESMSLRNESNRQVQSKKMDNVLALYLTKCVRGGLPGGRVPQVGDRVRLTITVEEPVEPEKITGDERTGGGS